MAPLFLHCSFLPRQPCSSDELPVLLAQSHPGGPGLRSETQLQEAGCGSRVGRSPAGVRSQEAREPLFKVTGAVGGGTDHAQLCVGGVVVARGQRRVFGVGVVTCEKSVPLVPGSASVAQRARGPAHGATLAAGSAQHDADRQGQDSAE